MEIYIKRLISQKFMEIIYWILVISVAGPIIGSIIGVIKKPKDVFMFNMLSFAAGVMISISFLELIPQSISIFSALGCSIGIVIGMLIMYALDKILPHIHPELYKNGEKCDLRITATYLIVGIFLHNFPEGMAVATGTVTGFESMLAISIAIAVQNVPEGICTSAPYYYCTKKRLKSFLLSASTSVPIVIGFYFARFLFQNITPQVIGIIIGAIAGMMIYISVHELIPVSCGRNNGINQSTTFSLIFGILFVMFLIFA
ncbi:hypothetical protein D6745_03520 [Candidatus Woesearchaeota archaeon]|nr:MAG: hypothetical protein D6745_03520 [Candidatus Woesearchaeota archaeon]